MYIIQLQVEKQLLHLHLNTTPVKTVAMIIGGLYLLVMELRILLKIIFIVPFQMMMMVMFILQLVGRKRGFLSIFHKATKDQAQVLEDAMLMLLRFRAY